MNDFDVFSLPVRFEVDLGRLQARFYELSRELHPDRFVRQGPEAVKASLEKMSRVNQAYTTLKDPARRRDYLLSLQKIPPPAGKASLPLELAEAWFDLQDAWIWAHALEFKMKLEEHRAALEQRALECERAFDSGNEEALLELSAIVREQSYLVSLQRDLDSKLARS